MRYAVIYERGKDGSFWGYAPDIPGATGAGDTLEEARQSVATGIALWIETARKRGVPIPESRSTGSEYVEVPQRELARVQRASVRRAGRNQVMQATKV